ncbi:MAG: hypothetical protein ACE5Q6_03475, partial [Dehalococcoidia bacterium]
LEAANRLRDRTWVGNGLHANQSLCLNAGDWQAARDFVDRGLAISSRDRRLLCSRTILEYELGEFVQGEPYLQSLLATIPDSEAGVGVDYLAATVPVIARIAGISDSLLDKTKDSAQIVLSSPSTNPNTARIIRAGLALLAEVQQDLEYAKEQYHSLESARGTQVLLPHVSVDRMLGILSHTMGNLDQAPHHFEDALAFCRKAGPARTRLGLLRLRRYPPPTEQFR